MALLTLFQQIFCTRPRDKAKFEDYSIIEGEEKPTKQKYLVLDLDETLIYSSFHPFKNFSVTIKVHTLTQTRILYLALRPHAHHFLQELSHDYKIVIYTSSKKEYCDKMLKVFGITKYIDKIFYRESCVKDYGKPSKNLAMLHIPLESCVLVDDSVDNSFCQPENFFLIPYYHGQEDDHTLLDLIPFLKELAGYDDVRNVEHRYIRYLNKKDQELERHK